MPSVRLSSVNLNLLVALDALLQTKSVSEAARRARVTKSAMSRSLSALRDLFSDPLLIRSGRAMLLSPYAESLQRPLALLLGNVSSLLEGAGRFDPASARRRFVIAAPDFFATLILPSLLDAVRREAPEVELVVVPSARRGNAWLLETGEVDVALGAVVENAPGIRRLELCTERFACAVRRGHPEITGSITLEQYTRIPHLMITLGDDDRPTWIDEALARLGRARRVAVRVRYFMAAPLVVARTDLLVTGPSMLLEYFARFTPLTVLPPPIELPSYAEDAYWHQRYDADPGHLWFRELIRRVTSKLGTGTPPDRTRWSDAVPAPRPRRGRRQS